MVTKLKLLLENEARYLHAQVILYRRILILAISRTNQPRNKNIRSNEKMSKIVSKLSFNEIFSQIPRINRIC